MSTRDKVTNKIHADVTPVDLANGKVKYIFTGTDTDETGIFLGQFTISGLGAGDLKLFTPPIVIVQSLPIV